VVFPRRCAGCADGPWPFCERCRDQLIPLSPPWCRRCGRPAETPVPDCADCPPPPVSSARSPFLYDGPARQAVHRLKFSGWRDVGSALASAIAACEDLPAADVITWVPLARRRLSDRGYDQARVLASGLGDRVALAVAHQRLAHVQLQLGNLEAADVEAHAAVAVSEAVGLRVHIGCGYRVKAEVAAALGHAAQAEDDFRRAIDILAAVKHEVELARAYQGLAGVKDRAGMAAEALKLRHRAADIFNRLRGAAATSTE
jgi:predicted amidophosphoribosyltransferase